MKIEIGEVWLFGWIYFWIVQDWQFWDAFFWIWVLINKYLGGGL